MFYRKLGSLKTHFESLQESCCRVLLNSVYLSGKFYKAKSTWLVALGEFCPYYDVVRKCFRVLRMIRISLELCSTNFKRYLNCYIFKQFIPGNKIICLLSASLTLRGCVVATPQTCVCPDHRLSQERRSWFFSVSSEECQQCTIVSPSKCQFSPIKSILLYPYLNSAFKTEVIEPDQTCFLFRDVKL